MDKYDVVYILKNDVKSFELRYSLRSIEKNLPHSNVVFVGGQPSGLIPDNHINHIQTGSLVWEKARSSLIRACESKLITDKFWLFNDDFFVLNPVDDDTPLFGGTLRDHILRIEKRHNGMTAYSKALRYCEDVLKQSDLPTFDYSIHVPMLVDKQKMLDAIRTFDCPMFRSIYGNVNEVGGKQCDDVKIGTIDDGIPIGADYVSTTESSFRYGRVGKEIRDLFSSRCQYELRR